MLNNVRASIKEHSVMGFFDFVRVAEPNAIKNLLAEVLLILEDLTGRKPDLVGMPNDMWYKTYSRMKSKIAKLEFGNPSNITFIHREPGQSDERLSTDCKFSISWTQRPFTPETIHVDFAAISIKSELCPLRSPVYHEISKIICHTLIPQYGFGYQMPFDHGPMYYVSGSALQNGSYIGPASPDNLYWYCSRNTQAHLTRRVLREVYPINFLTAVHLDAPVHETTLRDWILSDPRNGDLVPFVGDIMKWTVAEAERARISTYLRAAGRLLERHHVWPDPPELDPNAPPPPSAETVMKMLLGDFGYDSANEVDILKKEKDGVKKLNQAEKEKLIPPKKVRKKK